ncbi:MAG: chloride channel protein [Planctomycetes bacterium]|nr:chloride channel protein [Planctomycetota bacterium]MCP4770124.1 chloride channel protein [Planctomycetota bacterium]MCP4860728.1 chloride channel protein [Planctomycetota bacterium]
MKREGLFRTRGARREPWQLAFAAVAVGVASAAVAVALRSGVHWLFAALEPIRQEWWGMLLLPAAGAMLGVLIIRVLFNEPGGHGVPAVLEAVTRKAGHMRRRSIVSRLLGSLVNVASGGSAGLEGPIVYSAAAVGSSVAGSMRLAERQRVMLLACGVAGGIGAIFNAPLTGMIFAMEVVLAEWTLGALLPIAVSATVATEIGRLVMKSESAFTVTASMDWGGMDLAASAVLGGCAGLLSVGLVVMIFAGERFTRKLKVGFWTAKLGVVAGLGGLCVGMLGWLEPGAIGEGYEAVNDALSGEMVAGGALLLFLFIKLLATTITLGSNSPGGIFAPSLVLGALLGYGFGGLLHWMMPEAGFATPAFFALAAMAGLVSGSMQAPFTGIMLALETTGGWSGTLPLIMVSVVSVLVSRTFLRHSFYTWELAERGELMRPGSDRRILAEMNAGEMMDAEAVTILTGQSLDHLAQLLPTTVRNHFAVIDEQGILQGMLDLTALRGVIFDETLRRVTPVDTVMDTDVIPIREDQDLLGAMEVFEESGAWVLPVVDSEYRFLGTLSKSTLFDRYRTELIVQTADHQV